MEGEQRSSEKDGDEQEIVYKTKVVQFLGRSTPIILQNDNGPCPLLAICNVLLLRNSLNLGVDAPEVSLQKLLSLVAEKLIDSNNNIEGKDEGYAINQQQNIADAIDLLPRLATGIDVNVQFRKINDFEFTRECAIFDLLDIGLYHGWLVDPQDTETTSAIGSKSYNTLVGELVAFETSNSGVEDKNLFEEDSVDFAAATTAALGVPSPCLSRGRSFDECPESVPLAQRSGEGDIEEIEQLLRAVNMSKTEMSNPVTSMAPEANSSNTADGSSGDGTDHDSVATQMEVEPENSHQPDLCTPAERDATVNSKDGAIDPDITSTDNNISLSDTSIFSKMDQLVPEGSNSNIMISSDSVDGVGNDMSMLNINPFVQPSDGLAIASTEDQSVSEPEGLFTPQPLISPADIPVNRDAAAFPAPAAPCADAHLANGTKELSGASEVGSSSLDDSEPLYEGEECILDPEPVYEGEALLARQCDSEDTCTHSEEKAARQHCYVVKNFLESSASQLTFYGLFCLQEGLKERELCVFFRNNHFNTMFKFKGQLYLLATDQGYINQPDLVWEKLNEVNGDTVFMTSNFTEFKIENETNKSWSEQNAMTSTADYLATLEASNPASSFNSDLQLAIALQQQEFGQQSQQQQHQHEHQPSSQQPAASGRSRLVTGPQVARSSYTSPKSESKKDKCTIM